MIRTSRTPSLIAHHLLALATGVVLAATVTASASGERTAGTLRLANATMQGRSARSLVGCPQGAPDGAICWTVDDLGAVRGLGTVDDAGVLVVQAPHTSCEIWQSTTTLTVAGKGTVQLSVRNPPGVCLDDGSGSGLHEAALAYTVTGGTGAYADASGSGTLVVAGLGIGLHGGETLTGTLDAPATTFDLTPPVIRRPSTEVVRASKGASRARVQYAISAQDAVDGPVHATCRPASGHSFRLGRTQVRCTATDSSANAATAAFTVIVKR